MERKTMSVSAVADGADVPVAEAEPEVVEAAVADEADGTPANAGEVAETDEVTKDGDGETVNEDVEPKKFKVSEEAQKAMDARCAVLTAKRKAAETERDVLKAERDELAQRSEKLGDETVLHAARSAGVLPELIEKGDAARIEQWGQSERSVEVFGEWLEDNTDPEATLTIGDKEYTRAQVRDFKRQHQKKLQDLEDVPALLKTLKKDTAEIMRLGMQAKKAGWKPGQKPADAPPKKLPVAPTPARTATGGSAPRIPITGRTKSGGTKDIKDVDDLAAAIERGEI
jgi:hypothetical protein